MSEEPQERPSASSESPIAAWLGRGLTWQAILILVIVGILVFLPSIRTPFLLDDYLHRSMANGAFPVPRGPFDLYDFVSDRDRQELMARGILPWWTDPSLEIRFFRPLSSSLLWLDHKWLGTHPLVLHAHSFAWWIAAMLSAKRLYGRVFSKRVALMATVVFALAPCHMMPLAWLANREALVSLTFGLQGLVAYQDFRAERRAKDALLAALFFALAAAAGEYALSLAGYILAFEIFRPRAEESLGRRVVGLLPWALPTAIYLVIRSMLGYGTRSSGFYSDPTRDLGAYLESAPRRLLLLLSDAWFSLDGETLHSKTPFWVLVLVAALALGFLVRPVREAIARLDEGPRRGALALLVGSVLAMLPVMSVVPAPRVLGAAMVGVAAVVSVLLDDVWMGKGGEVAGPGTPRRSEHAVLAALLLAFVHVVHGPFTAFLAGRNVEGGARRFAAYATRLGKRTPESSDMVVMRGLGSSFFLPFAMYPHGVPPKTWRILSHTGHVLAVREDEHTLTLLSPNDATLFPIGNGNLFRTERARVAVGEVFVVPGMKAEVLEVGPDGPRKVRYTFDESLDDETKRWISETQRGFPATPPPEPGFGAPFDP